MKAVTISKMGDHHTKPSIQAIEHDGQKKEQ
jgi:hypothetical protein